MGAPHTPETRERVLQLTRDGVARNDIHRETGVAAGTISKWVREAGLSFDRTDTKAATQARKADLADRRAAAADREMQILEGLQKQMLDVLVDGKPFKKIMRSGMGAEEVRTIDFIPGEDAQRLANARSSTATVLDRLTRDESNDDTAKSLLVGLAGALGLHDPEPADAGA